MIDQKDLQDESEFAYQTTVISSIVGWSLGMFFGTNQDEPTATARDLVYTKLVKV